MNINSIVEGRFHVHTWSCVYGEIAAFPVILRPNATRWLILEHRQHRLESNLTTAAETSEVNLFLSKRRTVIADSLIWFWALGWWMCWWMQRLDHKCEVRENNHCLLSDKQTDASWVLVFFIIHGFLHCFCMTGLNAWIISFLFHKTVATKKEWKESSVQWEYWFVTYETVQSYRGRRRRGIESNFSEDVIIYSNTHCCPS